MNRAQRRAARKATPACMRATKEQRIAALIKNGITPEDLEREYHNGYRDGCKKGTESTFKAVYAAVCLALKDTYGFGPERCARVLRAVNEAVIFNLSTEELIDEVWERVGLRINFDEPFAADQIESEGRRTWAKQ